MGWKAHRGALLKAIVPIWTVSILIVVGQILGEKDLEFIKVPAWPSYLGAGSIIVSRAVALLLTLILLYMFSDFWTDILTGIRKILLLVFSGVRVTPLVDTNSRYVATSIPGIVKEVARQKQLHIEAVDINDRLHINDLINRCKAFNPNVKKSVIRKELEAARATAFTKKYAGAGDDEKRVNPNLISIDGHHPRPWQGYLCELLERLNVVDLARHHAIVVGIGNGEGDEAFLNKLSDFTGVDLSADALGRAKSLFPRMNAIIAAAEDLSPIGNAQFDLYLSLRTFQSTLFDRRQALHEAFRVLTDGGLVVLSIPTLYLNQDGSVVRGLIPPGDGLREPSMDYAKAIVERIVDYMKVLNFRDVQQDSSSPFETYITGRRIDGR